MRFKRIHQTKETIVTTDDTSEREFLIREVRRSMSPPLRVEVEPAWLDRCEGAPAWKQIYPRWWDKPSRMWRGFDKEDLS